jgi:hypothetical protein
MALLSLKENSSKQAQWLQAHCFLQDNVPILSSYLLSLCLSSASPTSTPHHEPCPPHNSGQTSLLTTLKTNLYFTFSVLSTWDVLSHLIFTTIPKKWNSQSSSMSWPRSHSFQSSCLRLYHSRAWVFQIVFHVNNWRIAFLLSVVS